MGYNTNELEIIKDLSKRLVEAQHQIRILDSIKWSYTIREDFFANKGQKLPNINKDYYNSYRPLAFVVEDKQEEFRLILRDAQRLLGSTSPITSLLKRRCDEYILAVQMLQERGTPIFSKLSMELYGSPDEAFYLGGPRLSELGTFLSDILLALEVKLQSQADVKRHTPIQAQEFLQERLSSFFSKHSNKVNVMVSDGMVADASAGADTIKLSRHVMFSDRDLKYLEVHEGWVHIGTTLNGLLQPYCFFLSKGAPSSSVIQEGLAVITEVVTFSSYPGRVRKITNRVIALDKVRQGADFIEIYRFFIECGLTQMESYNNAVRVFRGSTSTGGPFTKDLSYAKGFLLIYNFIRFAISERRIDAIPLLFVGKLVLDDLPLLAQLYKQQLLILPVYLPTPFQDLAALSAWLSLSLFLNKFSLDEIQKNFSFLLN